MKWRMERRIKMAAWRQNNGGNVKARRRKNNLAKQWHVVNGENGMAWRRGISRIMASWWRNGIENERKVANVWRNAWRRSRGSKHGINKRGAANRAPAQAAHRIQQRSAWHHASYQQRRIAMAAWRAHISSNRARHGASSHRASPKKKKKAKCNRASVSKI